MARPSYGPEAKKRSLQLFTTLLDYANDELEGDERAIDALRPHVQTHWQTEQRLVVRTKIRFLEALMKLAAPLSGEQIKEALRRFEDYLNILDDNRPNKGGSEVWHFTLNLWCRRSDRAANLQRFEQEWKQRRPQKSKQAVQAPAEETPNFWWTLCRESLEAQQYQRLTINPLTVTDGVSFDLHELYLPLRLLERKRPDRHIDSSSIQDAQVEESEETETDLSLEEFLSRLPSKGQQRIAIVGEPGAGKTTLLQKIANWLLEQQALPVWISLADLQGATLENYLLQDWLKQATRKISVSLELQEEFAQQFQQRKVWLLLDAIDEMTFTSLGSYEATDSVAVSTLARQLRGWLADAHVVLTCRSNVWDSGKNALDGFTTYCNRSFSNQNDRDQVGQFIDRWFYNQSKLGTRLKQELNRPQRKRIRDAVKNPLRLALLCRSWSLTQGSLPNTKSLLYQQFVETIYTWKQDRFSTTLAQRQKLNRALGQVALRAFLQPEIRFRLPDSFAQMAFGESIELMSLALQLGWLNQVGISTTTGEKVYAFYHPTFQEYFAAQAIAGWRFFLDPSHNYPVFNANWREVILLWLGRPDISAADKEALIETLTSFDDQCGGFYSHRAYFLAAAGLAEFPQCNQAEAILSQLIAWRFGIVPTPLRDGARVALLQTDRTLAITALEQFLQIAENPFACWQAAYTLGKTLDPGNSVAIAALTQLINTLHNETLRLQVIESLGRIDPGNSMVMRSLEEMLESTQQDAIRRRVAYSLGKTNLNHPKAIATLETLINSATNSTLKLRTAENLIALDPENAVAIAVLELANKKPEKTSRRHQAKASKAQDLDRLIAITEQRLATVKDAANQRRIAYRLGTLQPGHPQAIDCLLQLLLSKELPAFYKRVAENLKEVLLDHQLIEVVVRLKGLIAEDSIATENYSGQLNECYKLLWYCAQRMPYFSFLNAW